MVSFEIVLGIIVFGVVVTYFEEEKKLKESKHNDRK